MAIQKYRGPTTPIESNPQSSGLPRRRGGLKSRPQQPRPKVGINYRTYQPENWEQVQRPVIRKWSPSYDVSYWENPVNIARNYWAIKSAAPGQEVPEWMDAEGVEAAYKYMTHIQGSDDWTNWKHINPDDPVRQYLQGMQAPPMEWQLKPEDYQKWLTSDLSQRDPDTWTDEEIYKLSPELQSSYNEYRQMWNEKVPFEDLPTWQQMQYHIQSNPVMGGAATMVPFALAGGAGGLAAGGPIGGLIGAGAPLAMGAGLGYLSQKYPTAAELLQVLDWPAEQAERAIGLGLQIQGSLVDPETYGSLQEITQNLPTAYEAGTTAYTAGAPFNVNQEDAQAWYDLLGIEGEARAGRLDPTNIFPAAEYALRYISGKDTSGIQFADPSQVHPQLNVITDDEGTQYAVGGVTPVDLDAVGMSALVEARRRMVAGEDPDAVIQEYVDKFGFSGEFTELAGHIALDPLNFVPKVSSRGVGFVADLQGNKPLARAFYSADGPVHGWKQYKNFVNQGLAGASDELSAFQLFVGGLTDNGVIKSLDPEYTSTNPVKRWLGHLSNLTPEAKTRTLLAMGSDNINNVLDFRRGDPLGMGELVRGLINEDPAKMARTAQYLGSPEWATLRQAASSFEPKLADLENIWKGTEQHRSILNDIKQITGLDEPTILKLASESETAQALHTKLMSDAAAAGDEALQSLEVGDLRQIVDAYTGDNPAPWHPDEYAARLSVSWGEHLAEWGIEQYGVTKPSNVTKFWNTMKRAQSVVLLGFNPAYAVNNVVNNSVTRAATGIWGYASPGTISKFWQDWGYVPYRAEAGTGVAQAVPDIQVGAPGEAGSISQTLGTYRPGEEIIRQAATPETKGPARRVIDAADKLGIFTKVSGAAERVESAQSMYAGTTKFWRNNWKRRRGFELWSSELKQGFNEAFPEIRNIDDAVYSILEGSPSRTIAEQRLNDLFTGNGPIHDIDLAMNDIAKGMGVDAATVRENLSLVDDSLRANLEGAQTVSDYQTAYAKTRADARDAIAQQLADDLNTRFDQVTTQGGGGGFAEAQRIYSDAQFSGSEFWVNDLMAWQDTIDKAWEMRASGTDADVINTLYRERRAESNADWSNHRKFERSTWLGFLESMGVKDADSRAFLKGTDDAAKLWDDYFGVVEQRRSEFFKIDHGDDFKRAWMEMEEQNIRDYALSHEMASDIRRGIDDIFVEANRMQFGEDAAKAAGDWRKRTFDLHDRRSKLQTDHRLKTLKMNADQRRTANHKFYNEEYLPAIQEIYKADTEASTYYSRTVAGDVPIQERMGMEPGPPTEAPPQESIAGAAGPGEMAMPEGPPSPVDMPPAVPESTIANANEVRKIANDFGIPTDRGDTHLVNALNKYGNIEVNNLDDLTPQQAQEILSAREVAHEWRANVEDLGGDVYGRDVGEQAATQAREGQVFDEMIGKSRSELPEGISEGMNDTAKAMLGEFLGGRGDERVASTTGEGWVKGTTNVQWYSDIYKEGFTNRKTIENALNRIVEDAGKDIPRANETTLPRLKQLIIDRMLGEMDSPTPPHPGLLMLLQKPDEAASALRQYIDAGYSMDELVDIVGSPEALDDLFERMNQDYAPEVAPEMEAQAPLPEEPTPVAEPAEITQQETDAIRQAARQARKDAEVNKGKPVIPDDTPEVLPAHGNYPPGYVENILQPEYRSQTEAQFYAEQVRPLLDALEARMIDDIRTGKRPAMNIPDSVRGQYDKWINQTWGDMQTNKIAAVRWGENLRDEALLNYSKKREIDNKIMWLYPYQFWYTRSMWQWAQRAIDRPAWFANYSRLRNFMTRRASAPGFPSRLRNKMAIPAPYLPDWAGGNVWVDPLRKIFPIEEFTGPIDQMARSKSQEDRAAENYLVSQYNKGNLSEQDAIEAFSTRAGGNWEMAIAEVQRRNQAEEAAPESWMNMIMSPAAYLSFPAAMITGKDPFTGKEPGVLPITRTGQALESATAGTPLQAIGSLIGGAMAAPESTLREWKGMSEFGEWGDYYVDRQITNMVAEGVISEQDANIAMVERQGQIYDQAKSRVQFETMLKTPGALPVYAAGHGGNAEDMLAAMMFGWMPGSLLPDGELEHRGLGEKYKHARTQYNLGDESALNRFMEEHPQYEARMSLYQEPDERLRNFLISEMWETYSDLSGVDKTAATEMLGPMFQQGFLDDQTRNYDLLDSETLSHWLRTIGGQVPMTEETQGIASAPDILFDKLQTAPPNEAAFIDAYRSERSQLFPNWYAMQDAYFNIPEGQGRKAFLGQFPELAEYWDWNRSMKEANPVIGRYVKPPQGEEETPVTYDLGFVRDFTPGLTRQLFAHYYGGEPLTAGTSQELHQMWNMNGRPGGNYDSFVDSILRNTIAP